MANVRRKHSKKSGGSQPKPQGETTSSKPAGNGQVGRQIAQRLDDGLTPVLNDPAKRGKVVKRVVAVMESEEYRGPIPHPAHFGEYERACPGAGSKLLEMADSARTRADDRYDLIVKNDHQYRVLGMCIAGVILVSCLVAGVVLCVSGHPYVGGSVLAVSGLTAVVSRFIDGKKSEPKP